MPRFVTKRKGRLKTSVRAERAKTIRIRKGHWIDPFPWIEGTLPEKMVYAELSRRGIRFAFQNEVPFIIPEIDFNKAYRPDIIIPDLKIIIEVQGSYWHSKPQAIQDDAFKFAVYQQTGWRVLAWWDYDIMARLQDLFASEPTLRGSLVVGGRPSTEYVYTTKINRDDGKGIVTLNRRRAFQQNYKRAATRQRFRKA